MSKQVMLRVPDDVYLELEKLSMENMRPVASEALFRMRLGMGSIMYKDLTPPKATPKEAMAFMKEVLVEDETLRVEDSPQGDAQIKENKKAKLDKLVAEGLITKGFSKADQLSWNHRRK